MKKSEGGKTVSGGFNHHSLDIHLKLLNIISDVNGNQKNFDFD